MDGSCTESSRNGSPTRNGRGFKPTFSCPIRQYRVTVTSETKPPATFAPCIYCGSTEPRAGREHVMPQGLGMFAQNWTGSVATSGRRLQDGRSLTTTGLDPHHAQRQSVQMASVRTRTHPPVCSVVLAVCRELPRPRGNDARAGPVCRPYDDLSMGAALCAGDRQAVPAISETP